MKTLFALFFLTVGFQINLHAQSDLNIDTTEISKTLYKHVSENSPGIAVGIVSNGEVIFEHYSGLSNLEHQIKIDQKTSFNIASNAKQYTALSILKLVDQGRIHLDDDIRTYLPTLFKEIEEKITISQLINHTSGIRDYCELMALQGTSWWKRFIGNGDVIKLLQTQKDLNFKPGSEYLYSNSNYILLAELVEKVTDQDFDVFTKKMFEELQMPNTKFLSRYSDIVPNKATPYGNWNGWRAYPSITSVHGDGALYTTLSDQLKWEQLLQTNGGNLLSANLVNQSQLPVKNSAFEGYGYGLFFDNHEGKTYAYHDGATGAYQATFLRFPSAKVSVVIMSNNGNVPSNYIAWEIAKQLFDEQEQNTSTQTYPSEPNKIEKLKSIQDIVGNYKSVDGTVIRITEKEGSLYRELYQRDPIKLIQEKNGLFEYETIEGLKINFTNIGTADQSFTLYLDTQEPTEYYKVGDLNKDKTELNGRYYNAETETEIVLMHKQNNEYALTKNGRERKAILVSEDYIRMMGTYEINVVRDSANRVIGLSLDNTRIKNIAFNKLD